MAPSDVMVYLDHRLRLEGEQDPNVRADEVSKLLDEAEQYDQAHYDSTGAGCGVVGWFRAKFMSS